LSSLPRRIFSIFSLPRRLLTSHSFAALPSLHSFPTRRSSDLFLARRRADVDFATTQGLDWRGGAVLGWSGMRGVVTLAAAQTLPDRKSTRLNSSHVSISYAVFCLKKKKDDFYIEYRSG